MSNQYHTKNGRTSRRGAFIGGVWHCDCEPRMPAEKFQTKNGGKNHGRWFYTCQKPQPKRCGFFLWQDDAQTREQAAVLGNSTSEPNFHPRPQTPTRTTAQAEPLTPFSKVKPLAKGNGPYPEGGDEDSQETIDFDLGDSNHMDVHGEDRPASLPGDGSNLQLETPRKATKTNHFDTPRHPRHDQDIFETPSTSNKTIGLMSPMNTTGRQHPVSSTTDPTTTPNLVTEVLKVLKPANISTAVEEQLIQLLTRHELRTQGIAKGRDITRLAVQSKERKIVELQARISSLESDREISRTVIAHLKQDIATSPKRPKIPQQPSRSDV